MLQRVLAGNASPLLHNVAHDFALSCLVVAHPATTNMLKNSTGLVAATAASQAVVQYFSSNSGQPRFWWEASPFAS
jgi:hypothetical protein